MPRGIIYQILRYMLSITLPYASLVLQVTEVGSIAAEAEPFDNVRPVFAPGMRTEEEPEFPKFIANHPFMFVVVDKKNRAIFFIGKVVSFE